MATKKKKAVIKAGQSSAKAEVKDQGKLSPAEGVTDVSSSGEKKEPPRLVDAEKLQEEQEKARQEQEKARQERVKEAGTGVIQDSRVFQLMYLEKCVVEASLQAQVRKKAYEERINALKQECNHVIQQWESTQKKNAKKIAGVRRDIEEDYGIFLNHWGYDDETGVLQKLSQAEIDTLFPPKKEKDSGDHGGSAEEAGS